MRPAAISVAALLLLLGGHAFAGASALGQQAIDAKKAAEGWIARADSVRTVAETVLDGAVKKGAEEHPVAKDNVLDARHWLEEGAKALDGARTAYEAEDYEKSGNLGNMAWQYYVKAGTAAVLAARLVGGG